MTQHTFDFTGQTVIVTGGATGIGRATALAFGRAGANVVIASIGDGVGVLVSLKLRQAFEHFRYQLSA